MKQATRLLGIDVLGKVDKFSGKISGLRRATNRINLTEIKASNIDNGICTGANPASTPKNVDHGFNNIRQSQTKNKCIHDVYTQAA